MLIKKSTFSDFPQNGAITIEVNDIDLDVSDSVFMRCDNHVSGGAIRVSIDSGRCCFERDCGTECYTTQSRSGNDFGQFILVNCSNGDIKLNYLASSFCPGFQITERQIAPLGIIGNAKFIGLHCNSSNNNCYFGPGVSAYSSNDVTLSYMNFANDTTYCTDRGTEDWIAVVFYESVGAVKYSNFYECKSLITNPTKPFGTYSNCIFTNCKNYNVGSLSADNMEGSPSDFGFPHKCAAHITNEKQENTNRIKTAVIVVVGLISEEGKYLF